MFLVFSRWFCLHRRNTCISLSTVKLKIKASISWQNFKTYSSISTETIVPFQESSKFLSYILHLTVKFQHCHKIGYISYHLHLTKSFCSIRLYNIKIFWIYIDAPKILTFFVDISNNNSITLTCIAEGLPKPSYAIFSDEKEIKGTENGILIIPSYHLNDNVAYKCISRNNLGHDTQDFSPSLLRGKFDIVT